MDNLKNKMAIGFLYAMLISLLGTLICVFFFRGENSYFDTLKHLWGASFLPKIITLGTLPNLLLFHWFIKKDKIFEARGVVFAVIVLSIIFAILKLQ